MMIDRATKAVLFAIALGLWANVVGDWLRPAPVAAQALTMSEFTQMMRMASDIASIASNTSEIARNTANIPRPPALNLK